MRNLHVEVKQCKVKLFGMCVKFSASIPLCSYIRTLRSEFCDWTKAYRIQNTHLTTECRKFSISPKTFWLKNAGLSEELLERDSGFMCPSAELLKRNP